MVGFLDSSSVLEYILEGSTSLDPTWALERVFCSELLGIECRRAIFRDKMRGKLDDGAVLDAFDRFSEVWERTETLELTPTIKQRAAESFPFHVKTLDALHLATALTVKAELGEQVVVFSHDLGLNRCAKALGLAAPWLQ